MTLQLVITIITILSFFVAFFWIVNTIRRSGGSFYITKTYNGETSQRFDFNLAKEITMTALLFALYVFMVANFACFILMEEWIFGLFSAKGTLVGVLVYTVFYIIDYIYTFAKDKSEKRVLIREVKRKRKRESKSKT